MENKEFVVGYDDMNLMTSLRNSGTDHCRFMRMITVYLDITAPLYWWKEFDTYFDTYKVSTVVNPCSTMNNIERLERTDAQNVKWTMMSFTVEEAKRICEYIQEQLSLHEDQTEK